MDSGDLKSYTFWNYRHELFLCQVALGQSRTPYNQVKNKGEVSNYVDIAARNKGTLGCTLSLTVRKKTCHNGYVLFVYVPHITPKTSFPHPMRKQHFTK